MKNVLIVGAGSAGKLVIQEIKKYPELNYKIIGFVDDDPKKIGKKIKDVFVMGKIFDIPSIILKYNVDQIIIAIPSATGIQLKKIISKCEVSNVDYRILPGLYKFFKIRGLQEIRNVRVEDLLRREPITTDLNKSISYLKNKIILITGAAGSIGSELCRQIAGFAPKNLILLDQAETPLHNINLELLEYFPNIKIIPLLANIKNKNRLDKIFRKFKPNVLFHVAAYKHVPMLEMNPEEGVRNNIFGTLNLIDLSKRYNVNNFVLISTDKAVNPTNIMGASKRITELMIQSEVNSKTRFVGVRFGNVLASNGSVVPLFQKQIEKGGPVTITHPKMRRYFMTIFEAAQLVIQAGAIGNNGEIMVLDMGKPYKIVDLAKDLIKLSGLRVNKDIKIKIIGKRPGEKLFEEILTKSENTTMSKNKRIFIAKLDQVDKVRLNKQLSELSKVKSKKMIINKFKEIIPEFKHDS